MTDSNPTHLGPALCDIDIDLAVDALLGDYIQRLTTLLQGFRRSRIGEDEVVDVLEEALERRAFMRRFEAGLRIDNGDEGGKSTVLDGDVDGLKVEDGFVSLPSILALSEEQKKRHAEWTPMEDENVLVWLSVERPAWPGKVLNLDYFSPDCLPDIPRNQIFAVNLYNLEPSPTISIHSHLIPLSYIPQPTTSDSSLSAAYSLAFSNDSLPDNSMRSTYGTNPTRMTIDGRPWITHLQWLERQIKQEPSITVEYEERRKWQRNAKSILSDLGKNLNQTQIATPHTAKQPPSSSPLPSSIPLPYSRGQIKKSRRKFQDLLDDIIVGPFLQNLDTSMIQDAIVLPRRGTPFIQTKSLPTENEVLISTGGASMKSWKDIGNDFVSPLGVRSSTPPSLAGEDDEMDGEGWYVVSKRKRRRTRCDGDDDPVLEPHRTNARRTYLEDISEES